MRLRLNVVFFSAIVMGVGLITLLGLLVGDDLGLLTSLTTVLPIRLMANVFVQLAVVTLAISILIGILNLLFVHLNRIVRGSGVGQRVNSLALVISFVLALVLALVDASTGSRLSAFLLQDVQVALESSLAALLSIVLIYGAIHILQRGVTLSRMIFVFAVLVVMVAALPLGLLSAASAWLISIPVSAGARGILIGIALATLITGVRVLIAQDRTYGE